MSTNQTGTVFGKYTTAIVAALKESPATVKELAFRLDQDEHIVRSLLHNLKRAGHVRPTEKRVEYSNFDGRSAQKLWEAAK